MTRLLLATVFTLGLCTNAFAASDSQVRALAFSMQNSVVAHDDAAFDAGVASDKINLSGLFGEQTVPSLSNDINASMVGNTVSGIEIIGEESTLLDPVCACGAHLQDDIPLEIDPTDDNGGVGFTDGGQVPILVGPAD